jgi:hypothetical protein
MMGVYHTRRSMYLQHTYSVVLIPHTRSQALYGGNLYTAVVCHHTAIDQLMDSIESPISVSMGHIPYFDLLYPAVLARLSNSFSGSWNCRHFADW